MHYGYRPYEEALAEYDPNKLVDGFNTLPNGEAVYYISNPALGLWADNDEFTFEEGAICLNCLSKLVLMEKLPW